MKYCPKCDTSKELENFCKNRARHDGLAQYCRPCMYSIYKERHAAKRKPYFKEYSASRAGCVKKCATVREQKLAYNQTAAGMSTTLLSHAVSNSKKRSHRGRAPEATEVSITREWIEKKLSPMICEVTGLPLSFPTRSRSPFTASIDRIDSSKGYTEENCRVVCHLYNISKNSFSDEDVLIMSTALVNNRLRS